MCLDGAHAIAAAAIRVAQAEWDLVTMLRAEARVHEGVAERARAVLVERGDQMALAIFDAVREPDLDLEKARVLLESAGAERKEGE